MDILGNADFIKLWENGYRLHPLDKALLAILSAFPEAVNENVADWPLGRRNQALAQFHTAHFGSQLLGWTVCDQCGKKLEFAIDGRELLTRLDDGDKQPITVKDCRFRVPTSRDLARIAGEGNLQAATLRLLENCRIAGNIPETWSTEDMAELGEKMAVADPLAEIALGIDCPTCSAKSDEVLDLPSFIWAEMEARAKRLLLEVHTLAKAYGWAESAILALSDTRRAIYMDMAQA